MHRAGDTGAGRIVWQPRLSVGYLDQYAEMDHQSDDEGVLKSAFKRMQEMEGEITALYERAAGGGHRLTGAGGPASGGTGNP